jgi:NADPH:quinone reductase-like Zn-dependent oxidoreductase
MRAAPEDDAMNPMTRNTATPTVTTVTMRQWLTAGDGIGELRMTSVPVPEPAPHEVLIRIEALSLNYRDLLVINGEAAWRPAKPVVPVSDAAGTVTATGTEVTRFAAGDRVSAMFLPHWRTGPLTAGVYHSPTGGPDTPGMLADYVTLDQDQIEAVPRTLDATQAATLPIAALTAWHAVAVRCRVAAGDRVLVHGTGGVALFAVQFATALGAQVAVTTSSEQKASRVAGLGAAHVIDYRRTPDVAQQILDWTDGRGVDHVIETVGGASLNQSLRAVRISGSIAFIGLLGGISAPVNTYELVTKNVELHGIETGSAQMYQDMTRFIDDRHLTPVIDSIAPLTDIQPALHRLAAGGHFGKIVLTTDM